MNINQFDQRVGEELPDWKPVARPSCALLIGQHCLLMPLSVDHAEALLQAFMLAPDERDWTWLSAERPTTLAQMQSWIAEKVMNAALVSFAVCTLSKQPCGVVCFATIEPEHGTLEIGHVTWSPLMQRSAMGSEAIFLLLQQAFALGYRRVAWRCDATNVASRAAAERLGFRFEGRFRQVMIRKNRNRDSDWLSIIDREWPDIQRALSNWLSTDNFTGSGQQKRPLSACFADIDEDDSRF
ncbi:GNAT family N-acetyltransferase [Pantoea deleyi]|uniref:GNAT family N-acetyltransferase n=1 Tax=Pantoea deleyi TaxID=470932 RepID=A0A506Q4N1_9GAMM|nr:GNAT family protein [Pantoea deleyi]ORM85824.1 GNAT family N-acetyltransferase [Pantoea deleyi]TPV40468.1 GNAT family N-acetyltransferase [Pantoea deleyi]